MKLKSIYRIVPVAYCHNFLLVRFRYYLKAIRQVIPFRYQGMVSSDFGCFPHPLEYGGPGVQIHYGLFSMHQVIRIGNSSPPNTSHMA